MIMLKDMGVLDETCTMREVTAMFVKVNLDDELYVEKKTQKSENSAELHFDEFWEIVVRVCNEKVPEPRDGPFEQTLDTWLRLFFLPAAKNAAERRKKMA